MSKGVWNVTGDRITSAAAASDITKGAADRRHAIRQSLDKIRTRARRGPEAPSALGSVDEPHREIPATPRDATSDHQLRHDTDAPPSSRYVMTNEFCRVPFR